MLLPTEYSPEVSWTASEVSLTTSSIYLHLCAISFLMHHIASDKAVI